MGCVFQINRNHLKRPEELNTKELKKIMFNNDENDKFEWLEDSYVLSHVDLPDIFGEDDDTD